MRILTPDQRALQVASDQHSALSHSQALAAGLSAEQVLDRVAQGRWRRPTRGVFVVVGSPDTPMQRIWVTYLAIRDGGGLISHLSSAALLGGAPFSLLPHGTVGPGRSTKAKIARIHRGTVPQVDSTWRNGIRLTTPSRTLVDVAPMLDRSSFVDMVDTFFCDKQATAESTMAAAARAGAIRGGKAVLLDVVEPWTATIEPGSPAEMRVLRQLGDLGVDDVVTQYDLEDHAGRFIGRLDIAVPSLRAGIEYDGVKTHNPRRWGRDEPRYADFQAVHWRVDELTKLDLLPGEPKLREIVARWRAMRAA